MGCSGVEFFAEVDGLETSGTQDGADGRGRGGLAGWTDEFYCGELVTEGFGVGGPVSTAIVEARFFDMVCRKVGDGVDRLGRIYGG
jgi:hypothetical protein